MTPMEQTVMSLVAQATKRGRPFVPSTRLYGEICDKLADAGALVRATPGRPSYVLAQTSLPGVA